MLQGYADDSGSDGTRIPFVLGGYILRAESWAAFSDDWKVELDRQPQIEYFKMSEAVSGEGAFQGMPLEFRKCKVRDLLKVIERHDPDGVCTFLRWDQWKEIMEPVLPEPMKNPYPALFFLLFDALVLYEKNTEKFPEKIQLDFDDQGEVGQFALKMYEVVKRYMSDDQKSIMGRSPTMLDDKEYVALQAADLLVWSVRRYLDPDDSNQEWDWVYRALYGDLWAAVGYNRDTMKAFSQLFPPKA